ncbi:MAG: glycosyltransferase family 2 protein [Actinomycetes bacterium]
MQERPPLRVVVVHWNQPVQCIATIGRFAAAETPVRITVVDNASTPANLARLRDGIDRMLERRAGPTSVEVVEAGGNAGFGPGANVGLRRFLRDPLDGDWVVVCPHDVDPATDCLAALLEAGERDPLVGLMCADVGDGMVPVIDPYFGGMVVPAPPGVGWLDADYPHGTLMMARRSCLAEVGIFDERYFSYCEEADLGLRARRAGWRVGLVRGARVTNQYVGSSVALVDYLQTRNTLLLVQEMSGWYHVTIRASITLWQTLAGVLRPDRRPLIFDARARLRGLRDFALRRFGPPSVSPATERRARRR